MAAELAIIAKLQDEASSGIRALRGEVEGLGTSGETAGRGFSSLQAAGTVALTAIATAAAAAGAAIIGFVTSSVSKAAELEAQMDTVAALLGATAEQAELLRQATLDLALDPNLAVSATEAAQAIEMLAQNGLTVEQILGGAAEATVQLANATGADFATAARIATDAMALWGMEADQLGQVADGVTAVLVQSKFEVNDYALALAQAGGVAAAVGVSFEDFNATLVAIAPYFASGSDAGTSYKTMLQRLIPTTNTARDAMAALGLITEEGANAFFNADGSMKDMAEVAGILNNALAGLSEQQRLQALSTIFGTDAMRAAAAMSQFTEEEFRNLMAVMANTSAAEIAAQRMQNFSGAMDIVRGVLEGLQLMLGNVLLPILTQLALAGANLLAEWGPPLIAAFERLVAVFGEFFANIESGMSIWGALRSALLDIGHLLGMTADEAIAFSAGITNAVEAISNFIGPIIQSIASFVSWKDVLVAVGIAIASVVIPALIGIVQAVAPVVLVFAGLVAAVAALRNAWEADFLGIRTAVEGFATAVSGAATAIGALLSGNMSGFLAAFGQLSPAVQAVVLKILEFANLLRDTFQPTIDRIREAFGSLGENLAPVGEKLGLLKDAFLGLLQALAPVGEAIAAVVGIIAKFLGEVLAGIINNAGTILGGLVTFVTGVVEGVRNAVQTLVDIVRAILQGDWAGAWEAAKGFLSGWVDSARTQLEGLVQIVDGVMGAIWDAIVNTFNDLTGAALPSWEEFKTRVVEVFNSIPESIQASLGNWLEAVGNIIEAVKAALTGEGEWSDVGRAIIEAIKASFEASVEILRTVATLIQQKIFEWVGAENWGQVGDAIAQKIGDALAAARDFVADKLTEWQTAIFDWADAEDWQGVAETIAERVGEALADAGEAIGDQLESWRDAIFDWADAEDWQGVAETIAERVGEKLGEAKEAISGQLGEWQTAIFDWAGVEDWQGVADKIAEAVGLALGAAASAVAAQLTEWENAIFDWAGGADWGDVAETIAEKVGEWLGDVSDRVTAKLSNWITAITDWVNQQDWQQIGYDIMDRIITAFTEWKERIAGKLNSWVTDVQTETEGYAWWEIGLYILSKIAEGAVGLVSDWAQAVGAWVTNIGQAIAQHLGNLVQIGHDIVGGIASGIGAAGGLVDGAMQRLAQDTRTSAERYYQSESPSRLMMPIGYDVSSGIAVGILQGAGTIMDSISQLASQVQVEGAKAFGEAMQALAEGLAAGLNAILDLSAFPGVGGSFLDNLRTVVEMLAQMVAEVNQANVYGEEALKLLGMFVDVAGGIADLIAPLIAALTAVAQFPPINIDTFTANMAQLAALLQLVVGNLAAANQFGALVLEGLSQLLDVVSQIADTVGPFIAVLNDINAFGIVDLHFFHEGLAQLWYTMLMVVAKVQELAVLGSETLARMEGLLDVVGAIADLIGPFIESLYELNAFGTVDLHFFHEGLDQLAYVMLMVVGAMAEANTYGAAVLDAVQQFAETAGAIADMIGPMIEGLLQINALDGTMNEVAYHAVYFRNGVRALVDALASAAQLFTTGTLQHVQQFAETAGAIAEIIVPAVEGLMVIATLTGEVNYIGIQATYFRNGLRTIVSALASAAELFTAAILHQVQLFAETAGKIMELIVPAIEGFALIATLTGEVNYIGIQATYLRNGLRIVVDAISSAAELFTAALLQHTQLFAETAGEIVDLIADAIEALSLLAGYVSAAGLDTAAAQFAADLTAAITTIVNALQTAGLLANEAVVQAGELADGLADVLGLVEDGVDALAALASYVPNANLVPTAQQFAADLALAITTVVNALQLAGVLANEAIVKAGELADGLSDVLGMVEDGVGALVELATYIPTAGLGALANQFATDLATVITAVVNALQLAGVLANEAIVKAGELAGGLGDVLGVVEEGVGAIAALSEYVATSGIGEKANQFAADLAAVINAIVNGLQQAGILTSQAVAAAAELAAKLSDLLGVVSAGIEAIQALAEYQGVEGLQEKVTNFTNDLVAVATTLATQLTAAANAIGVATLDAARAFATAVTALASEVQAAMTALGQLAGMATPNIDGILAYIVGSAQQIQQSFAAAGDIGQAVAYAAAFRANLEQLVQEVQAAVAQLNALAGTGTSGSIGAALAAIAASLQNTEGQFAGAGTALAQALIAAMTAGINGGQGEVQGATFGVLDATRNAGESAANGFNSVGDAIIEAIARAVESGQGQVIAAVTQVVNAAIAAGVQAARAADAIGNQLIQAVLTEINNGRNQLDSAGSNAGNALIEGMARAITNGRSRVVSAIIETVRAAINAAQNALGISSPSKVAIDLMSNFMSTAANTVDSLRGRLASSMSEAIGSAAQAATSALGVPHFASLGTASLPATRPLSERVAAAPIPHAAFRGSAATAEAKAPQVIFYGNVVLPNVTDTRSFLEELDALRVT